MLLALPLPAVRLALSFFNGHGCGLYGVARADGAGLAYAERAGGRRLRLARRGARLGASRQYRAALAEWRAGPPTLPN